jgi:DNA-3-methyladenine glycosylase II
MRNYEVVDLHYSGDFSLADSVSLATRAAFVEAMRGKTLDLAFPLEGSWRPVAVAVEQSDHRVSATVLANPEHATVDEIRAQLERMLSLDIDGSTYSDVAARDKVASVLMKQRAGVRPVLLPSPYETAARAIIGHRLQVQQAAAVQARISAEHGVALDADGRILHTFPAPALLAALPPVQGLSERKIEQLRALGLAAADGWLDTDRLRAMNRETALSHLQELAGIGPFSAELILMRGVGDVDAFPETELRLHRAMAKAYDLGDQPDIATLKGIAEHWRPYRSWVGLLLRNSANGRI